ncbi:hypothetical protein PCA10_30410 [Metapseudomonas resinovorans NBRC 106553]|uniref:Uncharacterized protein n=1 Tax=Metapseudomonas resinovorans NBRC 106553 TaxID=1245471 RepID=S6AS10_METRE|nr:hypothetical protein PCA10_30410 [Pseudomonas resinovorans NBRC 106553]
MGERDMGSSPDTGRGKPHEWATGALEPWNEAPGLTSFGCGYFAPGVYPWRIREQWHL